MIKRIISLLLCIALAASCLPVGAIPVRAEESTGQSGWINLCWKENGEVKSWGTSQELSQLPAGVSYDPDTVTLTLNGADLVCLDIFDFEDTPFTLKVEGENTIHNSNSDERKGLTIHCCSDVTISGSGSLDVSSYGFSLDWHDYICSESTDQYSSENPDGKITISGVTLHLKNLHTEVPENQEDWSPYSPALFMGGYASITDNAHLILDGLSGVGIDCKMTVTNGAVLDAPFLALNPRDNIQSEDPEDFIQRLTIAEGGTVNLTRRAAGSVDHSLLWVSYNSQVILDGGTLNMDDTGDTYSNSTISLGGSDNDLPGGMLTIHSGKLDMESAGVNNWSGLYIGENASYIQYGGEVTISTHASATENFSGIQVAPGGSFQLLDGSIHVTGNLAIQEGTPWNCGFNMEPSSEAIISGGSLTIDGTFTFPLTTNGMLTISGGDVTVQTPSSVPQDFCGVSISSNGSFQLSGGNLQIISNFTEEDTEDVWLCGFSVDQHAAEALISSGSLTIEGPFSVDLSADGRLVISGGEVTAAKIHMPGNRGSLVLVGGTLHAKRICCWTGGTYQQLGGSMDTDVLRTEGSYCRFLGGEALIGQTIEVCYPSTGNPEEAISYGAGIAALYEGTGEAISYAEVGGDYSGVWATQDATAVSIKHQGVAAPSFSALMELMNSSYLTAGAVGTVRLTAALTSPTDTITVTLPEQLLLVDGSVTVNDQPAAYTETGSGFQVVIASSDVVRYGVIASEAGSYTITAAASGNSVALDVNAKAYTLDIGTVTNKSSISVSGTAAPGAVLTFYANGAQVLNVTANALGTWSAVLPLEQGEGIYQIYADIVCAGVTIQSETYRVTYDDNSPMVETLSITNTIHGDTAADPNQDVTVVINFKEGTRSQNYYTYWPELPQFRFAVKFQENRGTPETVCDVKVIATDYFGVEEAVPLTWDPEDSLWKGTWEFCGNDDIVPEVFQVEWQTIEEPQELPEPEDEEPVIPDPMEVNYTDAAMVISEALTYTFQLSGDAEGLAVTDNYGTKVTVTDNTFTGEAGRMYYATLTAGTFQDFETKKLTVLMPASGTSSYQLQDNVHTEMGTGYSISDVVISGENAYIITGIHDDGSYTYADAALEDVFASLQVDGLVQPEDGETVLMDDGLEEALTQAFLETDTYTAYTSALDTYAAANPQSVFEAPEVAVSVTQSFECSDGKYILTLTPEITVTSKGTASTPEGNVETAITGKFGFEFKRVYELRFDVDKSVFHGAAFYEDSTNSINISITASIDGTDSASITSEMEAYFGEELNNESKKVHDFLEDLTDPDAKKATAHLAKLKLRTNIPFLYIEVTLDLEFSHKFSGSASINTTLSTGSVCGFVVTGDKQLRPFYQAKKFYAKGWAEFHVESKTGMTLTLSAGPKLLNLASIQLKVGIGPTLKAGGHGTATISTVPEEVGVSAEFWVGVTLDINAAIKGELRMVGASVEADAPLFELSHPLCFTGTNEMPFRFTTVESEVWVHDDCPVTDAVSHTLNYQTFANGLNTNSKVFDLNSYSYSFEQGKFSISNGKIKVTNPLTECEDWLHVTYTVESGSYQVQKIVKVRYSPSSIVIHKTTQDDGPREAGFTIVGGGYSFDLSTNSEGYACQKVEPNIWYTVTEVSPPAGYLCTPGFEKVFVENTPVDTHFHNYKLNPPEITEPVPIPGEGDPSGYVFEGIESNRLEGVTVTLYRSDSETGADAAVWNAADFDQVNPLTTDILGQYLWMVPSGWYQVQYTMEGYDTECTDWMVVPPIRTGVNQAMTSLAPAQFHVFYSETMQCLVLKFNRPVMVSHLNLSMTSNGSEVNAWTSPVDAAWSVMEDPADSTVCATTFLLGTDGDLAGTTVDLTVTSITYAGVESTGSAAGTQVPEAHIHSYEAVVTEPTCTEPGYTTHTCACGDSYVDEHTDPLGHDYVDGTCTRCGEADPGYVKPQPEGTIRIAGSGRVETSLAIADKVKEVLGVEKFDTVVVASAMNFPDALTGSYLTVKQEAPILLVNSSTMQKVADYIKANLTSGGKVCILGGTSSVPAEMEALLSDFTIQRLAGAGRYDTNLAILEEAGVGDQEILIATGLNFADSLSASASGLPVLMVNGKGTLTQAQITFLQAHAGNRYTIIGGKATVSEAMEQAIEDVIGHDVGRISGATRQDTSVLVAKAYVQEPGCIVLANSMNFPDGLCGGPLAYYLGAPLILTAAKQEAAAAAYASEQGISSGYVLGGANSVSEATIQAVFGQ